MATLLDDVIETHDGPEPRILTVDVQAVLRRVIRPGLDDGGEAVATVAAKADVSTRTIYRILNPEEAKETVSLEMGDQLCIACGVHPAFAVRLMWPDGTITDYLRHAIDSERFA